MLPAEEKAIRDVLLKFCEKRIDILITEIKDDEAALRAGEQISYHIANLRATDQKQLIDVFLSMDTEPQDLL